MSLDGTAQDSPGGMVEMWPVSLSNPKSSAPDFFAVFGNEGVVKSEDQVHNVECFDNGSRNRYRQCLRLPLRVVEEPVIISKMPGMVAEKIKPRYRFSGTDEYPLDELDNIEK